MSAAQRQFGISPQRLQDGRTFQHRLKGGEDVRGTAGLCSLVLEGPPALRIAVEPVNGLCRLCQSGQSGSQMLRRTQVGTFGRPVDRVAKLGRHDAWVEAGGRQASRSVLVGKRDSEQHIRRLGLAICSPFVVVLAVLGLGSAPGQAEKGDAYVKVKVGPAHGRQTMPVARDADDPRLLGSEHLIEDQIGEQKVAQVIGGELALEAILGAAPIASHDASVVYKNVNVRHIQPGVHRVGRAAGVVQRCQVQLQQAGSDGTLCDNMGGGLSLGSVAAGEDEKPGLGSGDGLDEISTKTAGGDARDEDDLSRDDVFVVVGKGRTSCVDVVLVSHFDVGVLGGSAWLGSGPYSSHHGAKRACAF